MYVIIGSETHPDRGIEAVHGHYEGDYMDIAGTAEAMNNAPSNIIPGYNTRRLLYFTYEMTPPASSKE